MKKLLLLTIALVAVSGVASAAQIKQYASIKGNYAEVKAEDKDAGVKTKISDDTWGIAAAYGAKMCNGARAEVELSGNLAAEKNITAWDAKAEVETSAVMLNAYYDIPTKTAVKPYVGAGLGMSHIKAEIKDNTTGAKWKVSDNGFAWQIGAGVGYEIKKNITLDAGYRYMDYGKAEKDTGIGKEKISATAHTVYVGARFAF